MGRLTTALDRFTAAYHSHPELVAEQRGWSRTILLEAADTRESVAVHIEDGRIVPPPQNSRPADLLITADADTLCDILELRRGPSEPYLFGELTMRGSEADLFRLDYVTEALCPK